MKTLADFKRALTPGTVWMRKHAQDEAFKLVSVCKTQGNGVWVEYEDTRKAFLSFPKATEFKINEDGEAEIYWPPTYTYQGIEQERVEIPARLVLTYKKPVDGWDKVES